MSDSVRRGARIYSKPVLTIYDLLVIRISNRWAWRCHSRIMLERYNRNIGRRHLDVGPGTGWYLTHSRLPDRAELTLMDLNPNSLHTASARLADAEHRTLVGNALEALPVECGPFDSIALNYVLHCVPGPWPRKGAALRHLADGLSDDGVLFGSTILGRGVDHNTGGRALMAAYNRLGVFHNLDDDVAGLEAALHQAFERVTVDVVGTVALFEGRGPRRRSGRPEVG